MGRFLYNISDLITVQSELLSSIERDCFKAFPSIRQGHLQQQLIIKLNIAELPKLYS